MRAYLLVTAGCETPNHSVIEGGSHCVSIALSAGNPHCLRTPLPSPMASIQIFA